MIAKYCKDCKSMGTKRIASVIVNDRIYLCNYHYRMRMRKSWTRRFINHTLQ